MANKKISELTQIGVANLTDTDQLVVVDVESSATRRMSVANIKQHIVESGDTNIHHFASYANATFSTGGGGGGSGSADSVQTNLHSFASTANTNINSVQSNLTAFLTTDSTGNTTVVAANLVPSADQTYNLGAPNYRWKTVYAAAQTIDLDGLSLSNEGGTLKVTDDNSGATASFATDTGNLTVRFSNLESGISGANARIDVVAGNLDAYATYANSTFSGAGGSGPANTVQTNLHSFATYANATFGSGSGSGDADSVQTNVHALGAYANSTFATSASVTANKTISDTLGSYANSTFATDTNLNTVQSNVATNASTITANKSVGDTFGTYANATFASGSTVGLVQGNLDAFASFANASFETNPDNVQSNLAHLGSTANTNIGAVQSNLTAMFTTNTRAITVGGSAGANLVPQANNFFSLGSPTLVWKDLFVGPGTVTIGSLQLQDQDGGFTITSESDPSASTTISGETGNVAQRFGNVIHGVAGANARINIVQGNAAAYATYANATITANKSIADTYGSYANTRINIVQGNAAAYATYANTTITTNKSISDTYGTYANATFATTSYVDTEVAAIVDSAPGTLNTLNELAAALGDDPNLSVTLTNKINTISSNAATNSTNLGTLGSYSNTTFATITNLNTVSSNATTNSTNINTVQGNAAAFATYANATFATVSGDPVVDSLTDNVNHFASYANSTFATVSGDPVVDSLTDNVNHFASYANTTFSTHTLVNANVDSIVHGLAGANAAVTANKSISDTFGTYANSTFSTGGSADPVQSNLHALGSYANSTFATITNLNTVSSNADTNSTNIDVVQGNTDAFATYANSTFLTDTANVSYVSHRSPAVSTIETITVTVASKTGETYDQSGSGNAYLLDGVEAPWLTLAPGTYRFDQSDGTNGGHPLRFYLDAAKVTQYSSNVSVSGSPGTDGYTQIVIDTATPSPIYYQCTAHAKMGHGVTVLDGKTQKVDTVQGNVDAFASYANTTFATGTSAGPIQSNLHALGSYANSTFGTSATVTANKTISDTYGTYANSTFATAASLNTVDANVGTQVATLTTAINTVSSNASTGTTNINKVQGNAAAYASYANTTFASTSYVDTEVAGIVDSAPGTLNTLNELAAALGDDPNLSVTLTNKINTISSNAATNSTNLDTLGSYSNTTFATITNLNTVSTNAAVNTSKIDLVQSNAAAFASYSNTTFLTGSAANTSFTGNVAVSKKLVVTDRVSVHTYTVTNSGSSAYVIDGNNNPDLFLIRGLTYRFDLSVSGHPFEIRVSSGGSAYNTGVVGNQKQSGILEFTVPDNAPDQLVYQCIYHGGMVGNIYIVNSKNLTTNINTVSSNVGSVSHGLTGANAAITANKSISDTYGTYANSTFATAATVNTVQGNAAAFASYANSTFSTGGSADPVQSNLHALGSYANSTFLTSTTTQNLSNVGIGTATPQSLLHVVGEPGTYGQVRLTDDSNNNIWKRVDGTAFSIDWNSGTTRYINLLNSGAGNVLVGINTTSAAATLDVKGNLNVTGDTTLGSTLNGHTIPGGAGTLALTSDTTLNKTITDTFGSYANSTFATATNLNTVSSNAATNTTNINTVQGNAAAFASYANSTFSALTVQDEGSALSTAATTLNFVGSGVTASGTGATKTITISGGGGGGSGDADLVEANLDAFASYANSTFALATTTSNLASDQFTTAATSNTFTLSQEENQANNLIVTLGGLVQKPNDDYVVSGTTLTLNNTNPLVAGIEVEARHLPGSGISTGKSIAMAMIFGF